MLIILNKNFNFIFIYNNNLYYFFILIFSQNCKLSNKIFVISIPLFKNNKIK